MHSADDILTNYLVLRQPLGARSNVSLHLF